MPHTNVHAATSPVSVLGGWLAALGALTIALPLAALAIGTLPAVSAGVDDPLVALPAIAALFVAYFAGGYVAGRMAGYRTSWHGLMSAIWGLFIALVGLVVAPLVAENLGLLATLPRLDAETFGSAVTFGAILGFAAVVVGGWLGGVLAPTHAAFVERAVVTREVPAEGTVPVREAHRARRPSLFDRIFRGRRAA